MDCGVVRAEFSNGTAVVEPLMIQTDRIVTSSQGVVNLDTERIEFGFNTRARKGLGVSAGDLINPFIKVGGTLKHPSINLDATSAAITGGAAVASGGLTLLGQSLFNRFFRGQDPCGTAVSELAEQQDFTRFEP